LITRAVGDRLAFCPPLIIEEEQVDEMISALSKALDDALDEVG